MEKRYFSVNVEKYVKDKSFEVFRPASLDIPKDGAVMFVTEGFLKDAKALHTCRDCLVFWPESVFVPSEIRERHAVRICQNPHLEYCRFYQENQISYLPRQEEIELKNGAYIAKTAVIGQDVKIFPGAYVGGEVIIGDHVYIGSGVRLVGEVHVGNHVIIRENAVIGADGLSTDRDESGKAVTMPQFGGVVIEDHVQIGALTVIGRGAIDNTVIQSGAKIDNSCFISHNVKIGADTFVVGESILFGSSSTGERAYISGNATIRNGVHIGNDVIVGMGSNVVRNVEDGRTVKGNPAR